MSATLQWDPDLNGLRVENGKVMGVKCGLLQANPQPGELYFQLVAATFVNEVEAKGQHMLYVDVLDEAGRRLDGQVVEHGWPWERWPNHDDIVIDTVKADRLAQWGLYAGYDANRTTYGPYWARVRGKSDVFYGMGLPWNRHVSFVAVFQRTLTAAPPTPAVDPLEGIRNAAWNALFPTGGVDYNPDAAFAKYARAHNLGVPTTQELDHRPAPAVPGAPQGFRFQGFAGGIVYAKVGEWDKLEVVPW